MAQPKVQGDAETEYVTAMIGDQWFGLPIKHVQDVFVPGRVTRIPLAPPEIAGVLNLRGRIVTVIDMHRRLGLADTAGREAPMAIGIERRNESYGLLIDTVGEVLKLVDADCEENPVNLDAGLAQVSDGVFRLEDKLLVALDVDRVLETNLSAAVGPHGEREASVLRVARA